MQENEYKQHIDSDQNPNYDESISFFDILVIIILMIIVISL